jgi:hypothetical protein
MPEAPGSETTGFTGESIKFFNPFPSRNVIDGHVTYSPVHARFKPDVQCHVTEWCFPMESDASPCSVPFSEKTRLREYVTCANRKAGQTGVGFGL